MNEYQRAMKDLYYDPNRVKDHILTIHKSLNIANHYLTNTEEKKLASLLAERIATWDFYLNKLLNYEGDREVVREILSKSDGKD